MEPVGPAPLRSGRLASAVGPAPPCLGGSAAQGPAPPAPASAGLCPSPARYRRRNPRGGGGNPPAQERGMKGKNHKGAQVVAAQAIAEERRSQSSISLLAVQTSMKTATKPVIDGSMLRTEERQRLARERREEREKQHAAKETQILEKERKAKLQYEKQLEERQRKLKEIKQKEEQRRAAVEEKRKQKIEEEKERYEAVLHRTLEWNQRLEARQKRWSWGGSVTPDSEGKIASKRSPSTANVKQAEAAVSKCLSLSASLLKASDRSTTKRSASFNRLNNQVPPHSQQSAPKGSRVEQKDTRNQFVLRIGRQ